MKSKIPAIFKQKLTFSFIAIIFLTLAIFYSSAYHICIPMGSDNKGDFFIEVKIEGKKYNFSLATATNCFASINEELLNTIKEKKYLNTQKRHDSKNNEFDLRFFSLPKMKIGPIHYRNVKVEEESIDYNRRTVNKRDINGSLGFHFFKKQNVFFDLHHARIFLSNDLKKLKYSDFEIEAAEKVPFTISKMGIVIPVVTDFGIKNMVLDFCASCNIIRRTDKNIDSEFIQSSKFILGKTDFGAKKLYYYDLASPPKSKIDGILGKDFLSNHRIYVSGLNTNVTYLG